MALAAPGRMSREDTKLIAVGAGVRVGGRMGDREAGGHTASDCQHDKKGQQFSHRQVRKPVAEGANRALELSHDSA